MRARRKWGEMSNFPVTFIDFYVVLGVDRKKLVKGSAGIRYDRFLLNVCRQFRLLAMSIEHEAYFTQSYELTFPYSSHTILQL